jgi:glucose-6-phosphate isomerase
MALRGGAPDIDSALIENVNAERTKLYACAESIRSGTWRGYTNKPIRDVVHIGIGGSHLGPELITEALSDFASTKVQIHFVANIDGYDLSHSIANLNPETTLFIVASKSFSTLETLENARSARSWFLERTCNSEAIAKHFIGITNNIEAAVDFGLLEENLFPMRDWVGGRYSLWSSMGLPAVIAIGSQNFDQLLDGAAQVDAHFANSPMAVNLPLTCALAGVWNYNVLGCESLAGVELRPALTPIAGLFAAARNGEQWEIYQPSGRGLNSYNDAHFMGRLRHQWPTCLPPAIASRHSHLHRRCHYGC